MLAALSPFATRRHNWQIRLMKGNLHGNERRQKKYFLLNGKLLPSALHGEWLERGSVQAYLFDEWWVQGLLLHWRRTMQRGAQVGLSLWRREVGKGCSSSSLSPGFLSSHRAFTHYSHPWNDHIS